MKKAFKCQLWEEGNNHPQYLQNEARESLCSFKGLWFSVRWTIWSLFLSDQVDPSWKAQHLAPGFSPLFLHTMVSLWANTEQ